MGTRRPARPRPFLAAAAVAAWLVALPPTVAAATTIPSGTDIAVSSGLWNNIPVHWYGTYPYDVNNDGSMDVFLDPHLDNPGRLMINDGSGHFHEIDAGTFLTQDRHGCAWADVNQDGLPDMYCALGGHVGEGPKANELWMQQPDGTFTNQAKVYGVTDPFGRGREVTFLNANHDKWPDLYVTNTYPRQDGKPTPNRLFINQNGTSFRDAPQYGMDINVGGVLAIHSCVQAIDFNGDGRDDILTCGKQGLHLFKSRRDSSYFDMASRLNIERGIWNYARLVDLNGDGRLDLVGVSEEGLLIQLRVPRRFQDAVAMNMTYARQVATGDINGDSFPDVYVVRGDAENQSNNQPDAMLVNDGSGTHFLEAPIPQVPDGNGDSVRTADITGDGVPEFIVTNGFLKVSGSLEVLTFAASELA